MSDIPINDNLHKLRNKYNLKKTIIENKKDTDLLTQLNSYNYSDVEIEINNLKKELTEQKKLNEILKDEEYSDNIIQIEEFSKEYGDLIEDQRSRLKNLKEELEKTIIDNEKLKNDKKEYKDICNSQEYTNLAGKIREIKNNCSNIKHFLRQKGILD